MATFGGGTSTGGSRTYRPSSGGGHWGGAVSTGGSSVYHPTYSGGSGGFRGSTGGSRTYSGGGGGGGGGSAGAAQAAAAAAAAAQAARSNAALNVLGFHGAQSADPRTTVIQSLLHSGPSFSALAGILGSKGTNPLKDSQTVKDAAKAAQVDAAQKQVSKLLQQNQNSGLKASGNVAAPSSKPAGPGSLLSAPSTKGMLAVASVAKPTGLSTSGSLVPTANKSYLPVIHFEDHSTGLGSLSTSAPGLKATGNFTPAAPKPAAPRPGGFSLTTASVPSVASSILGGSSSKPAPTLTGPALQAAALTHANAQLAQRTAGANARSQQMATGGQMASTRTSALKGLLTAASNQQNTNAKGAANAGLAAALVQSKAHDAQAKAAANAITSVAGKEGFGVGKLNAKPQQLSNLVNIPGLGKLSPQQLTQIAAQLKGIKGTYANPFGGPTAGGHIDQGIDLTMKPGTPIRAIGNATVIGVKPGGSSGWLGQPFVWYRLDSGPQKGKYVYVAEQISPSVQAGQKVKAGQPIGSYASSGTAIETGWATPSGQTLASATPGYNSATRHTLGTDAGRNFASFLGSLHGGGVQLSGKQASQVKAILQYASRGGRQALQQNAPGIIKAAARLGGTGGRGQQGPAGAPKKVVDLFRSVGKKYGVDPAHLWGIYGIETAFGKNVSRSSAGAQGPMQFMPGTWATYGKGRNIMDLGASVDAAARYLKAGGYQKGNDAAVRKAIFAYNHSTQYVQDVLNKSAAWAGGAGATGTYSPSSASSSSSGTGSAPGSAGSSTSSGTSGGSGTPRGSSGSATAQAATTAANAQSTALQVASSLLNSTSRNRLAQLDKSPTLKQLLGKAKGKGKPLLKAA